MKQKKLLARVEGVIKEVEQAPAMDGIRNLKKLAGAQHTFRIRVGEYRLGVYLDDDTVEFVRCLDRKELYKYFP